MGLVLSDQRQFVLTAENKVMMPLLVFKLLVDWWDKGKEGGGRGAGRGGRGRGIDSHSRVRGGRGSGFHVYNAHIGESTSADTVASVSIPNLSSEQWATLAQFVNNQKLQNSSSDKLPSKKEKLLLFGKDLRHDIIMDSGASHYMTGDIELLTDVEK